MKDLADRLKEKREELGLTQTALAKLAKCSPGTIGNLEARIRSAPRQLVNIAAALGVSAEWLETGKTARSSRQVAHLAGFTGVKLPPLHIEWGDLPNMKLPETFEATLPDDAMAPELPKGLRAEFSTIESPRFGDYVIVKDASGIHQLRLYQQAPGGSWEAAATGRGYLTLIPERDGLEVVAVMTGRFISMKR